jgi:hypothetical protein
MGRRAQGDVFRKKIAVPGQGGLSAQVARAMVAAFGMGDLVPVSLADQHNRWTDDPRACVGEVIGMGQEPDGSIWADLDIRKPDVADKIRGGLILGASPVISTAGPSVTGLMISNRPPTGSPVGYEPVAASDSSGGGELVMLTSTSEEPFMIIGDGVGLAAGPGPDEAMQVWADAEADAVVARLAGTTVGRAFTDGRHRHRGYRGTPRPPVQLSADVSSADVDQAVAELAASYGVFPYVIEEQLAERGGYGSVMLTPADKVAALSELVALTAPPAAEVMLSAGPMTGADVAGAVESEVLRLSGEAVALAQRRGHTPGHSAGQHHSTSPNMFGGSPPHEPFFGPHTHAHDHPSHAHHFEHPDHGHVHAHPDGSPVTLAAGWPRAGRAAGLPSPASTTTPARTSMSIITAWTGCPTTCTRTTTPRCRPTRCRARSGPASVTPPPRGAWTRPLPRPPGLPRSTLTRDSAEGRSRGARTCTRSPTTRAPPTTASRAKAGRCTPRSRRCWPATGRSLSPRAR